MNAAKSQKRTGLKARRTPSLQVVPGLSEDLFSRMLYLELKRYERSKRPFYLALLECERLSDPREGRRLLDDILLGLSLATRATDMTGWYRRQLTLGVIFTEAGFAEKDLSSMMTGRILKGLASTLSERDLSHVKISVHSHLEVAASEFHVQPQSATQEIQLADEHASRLTPFDGISVV